LGNKSSNLTYALFGGSFDPPHKAHIQIVKKALEIVNRVIVVPTYLNPFKKSFAASAETRLEWCKELFDFDGVIVSDFEVKRQKSTYTIETFNNLSKLYNIKYIIIGADNLKSITLWRDFEVLNSKITWIVATRDGCKLDTEHLRDFKIINLNQDISSTEIRSGKKSHYIDEKIKQKVLDEYRDKK
jgi:nicotinate-nucleotide adenylyltransferase